MNEKTDSIFVIIGNDSRSVTPAATTGAGTKYRRPSECGAGSGIREQSGGFQWKGNNGTLSSGEAEYVDGRWSEKD